MRNLQRFELVCAVATALAGLAALVYAGYLASTQPSSSCTIQGTITYCQGTVSPSFLVTSSNSLISTPSWPEVILAILLFTPILLAILGFTIGDSISRARGSLPFLWISVLFLAGATTVALLPRFMVVQPPTLPDGVLFFPSVVLGAATAV